MGALQLSTATLEDRRAEFSEDLDIDLESLEEIQENAYCTIFRGVSEGAPLIVKKYKGDDSSLVDTEAGGVDLYHRLASGDEELIDSRTLRLNSRRNIVAIQFVHGERLSSLVYRGARQADSRQRAVRIMGVLGRLLARLHRLTRRPGEETSPFMYEYLGHCSRRLRRLPGIGPILFRGMEASARELTESLRASGLTPSFVHGDFVFRNMHVLGDRIGLIDFANTIDHSHTLNDVYNLRMCLDAMLLPRGYREELRASFAEGLSGLEFPELAHRFYQEFHRRRWLMLKLSTRHPLLWGLAFYGLATFAGGYRPDTGSA